MAQLLGTLAQIIQLRHLVMTYRNNIKNVSYFRSIASSTVLVSNLRTN